MLKDRFRSSDFTVDTATKSKNDVLGVLKLGKGLKAKSNTSIFYFKNLKTEIEKTGAYVPVLTDNQPQPEVLVDEDNWTFRITPITIPLEFQFRIGYYSNESSKNLKWLNPILTSYNRGRDIYGYLAYDWQHSTVFSSSIPDLQCKCDRIERSIKSMLDGSSGDCRDEFHGGQPLISRTKKSTPTSTKRNMYIPSFLFRNHYFIPTAPGDSSSTSMAYYRSEVKSAIEECHEKIGLLGYNNHYTKEHLIGVKNKVISDNLLSINYFKEMDIYPIN